MAAHISGHKPPPKEDLKVIMKGDAEPSSEPDRGSCSEGEGEILPEVEITTNGFIHPPPTETPLDLSPKALSESSDPPLPIEQMVIVQYGSEGSSDNSNPHSPD